MSDPRPNLQGLVPESLRPRSARIFLDSLEVMTDIGFHDFEIGYNLQESLAHAIYDRVAAMRGVRALRVLTSKPDVYPEARAVGVELASFNGCAPDRGAM